MASSALDLIRVPLAWLLWCKQPRPRCEDPAPLRRRAPQTFLPYMVGVVKTVGVGTQNKWLTPLSLFMEVSPTPGFTFFCKASRPLLRPSCSQTLWRFSTDGSRPTFGSRLCGHFPFLKTKKKRKKKRGKFNNFNNSFARYDRKWTNVFICVSTMEYILVATSWYWLTD